MTRTAGATKRPMVKEASIDQEIGSRLKLRRKAQGMTLEELAKVSGLSKGYLSQVERGQASPSISALKELGQALQVPLAYFFSNDGGAAPRLYEFVPAGQRRSLRFPNSEVRYQIVSLDPNRRIQFVYVHEPPGRISHPRPFLHEGEEVIYVIAGQLEYWVDGDTLLLGPGDAIWHRSDIPHRWQAVGDEDLVAVAAITPPSF